MTLRCKHGDLAIIIDAASEFKDCVGRVVRILGMGPDPATWIVAFAGTLPVSIAAYRVGRLTGDAYAPDRFLWPIRGVPVHDDVRDEVPA